MAKDRQIISEISSLTCCVCYEKIGVTKTLYCGHSICKEPCLCKLLLGGDEPTCLVCHVKIQLPPSGKVSDFPTNYGLGSVLRSLKNSVDSERPSSPREDDDDVSTPPSPEDRVPVPTDEREEPDKTPPPSESYDTCKRHDDKPTRFFCNNCSEDVCFACIRNTHREHEFDVRDPSDDDGAYVRDVLVRTFMQRRRQKVISMKLFESREEYLDISRKTEEDIRRTADRIRGIVSAQEESLLKESEGLTTSRSEYFTDLYVALENAMVRGNKLSRMIVNMENKMERGGPAIEFKVIQNVESAILDIDRETRALEQLCEHRHPHLRFSRAVPVGDRLVGSLEKTCRMTVDPGGGPGDPLTVLKMTKAADTTVERACVGVVWLAGDRFVSVVDETSSKGLITFRMLSTVDGEVHLRHTESLERVGCDAPIHVCGVVNNDLRSLLLAQGLDVVKVTFPATEDSRRVTYKKTRCPRNVEGVHWGQEDGEYFILTSDPWQVHRIDENGYCLLVTSLASLFYGPFISNTNSRFVVADISESVFIVRDTAMVFPERRICPPSSLARAWPAGMSFNRETGDWFLLWKSISGNVTDGVDWLLTRHTASFEFRGIVLSGPIAERDPRFFSTSDDKLAMLYHGGGLVIFDICSYRLGEKSPLTGISET